MTITRKIRQSGNSASVTLPKAVLDVLEVNTGDEVEFDIVGDTVMVRRAEPRTALERARQVNDVAARSLKKLLAADEELSEVERATLEALLKRKRLWALLEAYGISEDEVVSEFRARRRAS